MEEQLNTGNNETLSVDDVSMESQANDNNQNIDTQILEQDQETGSEQEQTGNQPFHKHPDWIKREQKMRELEEKLQEFESKFNESKQEQSEQESSSVDIEDIPDEHLMPLLSQLPKRSFEGKVYESMGDFYQDLLINVVKDMALLDRGAQKMSQAQMQEFELQNQQIAAQVQKSFGEDQEAYREFLDWSENLGKSEDPEMRALDELPYDKQAVIYKQFMRKSGQSGSKKNLKAAKNIAGASRPSGAGSYNDQGSTGLEDAYDQMIKEKQRNG